MLIALLLPPIFIYWALVPLLLSAAYTLYRERPKAEWSIVGIAAGLSWCWQVVSLTWSAAPKTGVALLIDTLPLALICIGSMWLRFDKQELIRIVRPFVWAACPFLLCCIGAFAYTCHTMEMSPLNWPILQKAPIAGYPVYHWVFRFMGTDLDHGYFHPSYNTLPLFFASAAAVWLSKQGQFRWWITALLQVLTIVVVLLAQSRMGLIYGSLLFVCTLLYACPNKRWRIGVGATLLVVGTMSAKTFSSVLEKMGQDEVRDELTDCSIRYIQRKPWLGSGIGAMNPIEMCRTLEINRWPNIWVEIDTTQPVESWPAKRNMVPHNQFLAEWVQGGIVAFLLCILLYAGALVRTMRSQNFWIIMMMLIFLILSFLEPPLYIAKGMYSFALMVLLSSKKTIY